MKDKRIENRISEEDHKTIELGVKLAKTDKHHKHYGVSSFMIESAVNRAKRLIASKNKKDIHE